MSYNTLSTQYQEITGTYGSEQIETTIFIDVFHGWYACNGSCNVNRCDRDLLIDGVDVETLPDYDCFTWSKGIDSLEELEQAIEA